MFRRKEKFEIPPVEDPSAPAKLRKQPFTSSESRYQSSGSTYNYSRDGDPYASPRYTNRNDDPYASPRYASRDDAGGDSGADLRDRYSRNRGVGDIYSRGEAKLEDDRNELLGGYQPSSDSRRFNDGPDYSSGKPRRGEDGYDEEDDVEGIKKQTRWVKQESASSTRNALRLAREAEETARSTLGRLGDQSEKLANTERHLDMAKGHSNRAADRTDELKQLNRSIFRPVITFNKDAKRAAADARVQARYEEEKTERERAMMDVRETQDRVGRATGYGYGDDSDELLGGRRNRSEGQLADRQAQRKRFQFESTNSDDEIEDEIDDNLDEIGDVAKRLKALAMATSDELDAQNKRIDVISTKTDRVDNKLQDVTRRQKKW